jgi:hypothetical protein
MRLPPDLLAAVGAGLDNIGAQPGRGRSLTIPGERGDAILISTQTMVNGLVSKAEFMVNVSQHLLPWTAYVRNESPATARTQPLEYAHGIYHDRLASPSASYLPQLWAVTPATLDAVAAELVAELRRALTTTWLPTLPRADLRTLVRDHDRRGPSTLNGRRAVIDLMCHIEDLTDDERRDYVRFFRARAADDRELRRLAEWIERIYLSGE